jgi:hypothetical protein
MRSSTLCWLALVLAVSGVAAASSGIRRMNAAKVQDLEVARKLNLELLRLRGENRRLKSEGVSNSERRRLELAHVEAEGLRARIASLQARESLWASTTVPLGYDPDTVSAREWVYAGRATPRAAIESVLWSAERGDVEQLTSLLGFSEANRERVDALFSRLPPAMQQEYGSAERVVATLMAGSFPKDASAMTIVGDDQGTEDSSVSMRVDHADGQVRTNVFSFHRTDAGWQLLVPESVLNGYETILRGNPNPEALSP